MGWRGTINSLSAAGNRIARENERYARQQEKEIERHEKKLEKIEEAKEKIRIALNNDYAAGKIDDKEYTRLSERMNDISDELIVFGKSAGVTLGKRYVCGKINSDQFAQMRSEFVPAELYEEEDLIFTKIKEKQSSLIKFKDACTQSTNVCQKCNQTKGFLKPLHNIEGIILCGKCSKDYKNIKKYGGFKGSYLIAEPCDISGKVALSVTIQKEWL